MNAYTQTKLNNVIEIDNIYTVHYFEFVKDYIFEGETHDFWEFVYVDKGEVEVMADDKGYKLKQGDMIFHMPNEFHNIWGNGRSASNIIVVSFCCKSPAMKYFEKKLVTAGNNEKNLLARIIKESLEAFSTPLSDPTTKKYEKKPNSLFGCEQLIRISLEQLFIDIIRKDSSIVPEDRLSSAVKERSDEDAKNIIISFMKDNICNNLTFEDVCKFSRMGKTNLKVMFRERTGTSVMEYYNMLKIEEAKRLIREENYNFTQIADRIGYSSIHYFSRHFKKVTGMSPSEYATSIKAKL